MNVHWDSEKCQHAGLCVKTLPEVFKVENGQFVIDTSNGSDEAIMQVVRQCPAQAFTTNQ